jgi:hypothetical protein
VLEEVEQLMEVFKGHKGFDTYQRTVAGRAWADRLQVENSILMTNFPIST